MKVFAGVLVVSSILATGLAGVGYIISEGVLFLSRVMMDIGNLIW